MNWRDFVLWIGGFVLGCTLGTISEKINLHEYTKAGVMIVNGVAYTVTPMKKEGER